MLDALTFYGPPYGNTEPGAPQYRLVAFFGNTRRTTTFTLGHTYTLEPLNPRITQNVGQQGQLEHFEWEDYAPKWALIRWQDHRKSRVRTRDLVDASTQVYHRPPLRINQTYYHQCELRVPHAIRMEWWTEDVLFSSIVMELCTRDPEALRSDPKRFAKDLGRAEGGISFRDTHVAFQNDMAVIKSTFCPHEQQNAMYPLIVARVINTLGTQYAAQPGSTVRERLIAAALQMLDSSQSAKEFQSDIQNYHASGWDGFYRWLSHPEAREWAARFNRETSEDF